MPRPCPAAPCTCETVPCVDCTGVLTAVLIGDGSATPTGFTVTLLDHTGSAAGVAVSQSDGTARLGYNGTGSYTVRVAPCGRYALTTQAITITSPTITTRNITLGIISGSTAPATCDGTVGGVPTVPSSICCYECRVFVRTACGLIVPGASVTATGPAGTYTGTTDSFGAWSFTPAGPGTYTVTADYPVFYSPGTATVSVVDTTASVTATIAAAAGYMDGFTVPPPAVPPSVFIGHPNGTTECTYQGPNTITGFDDIIHLWYGCWSGLSHTLTCHYTDGSTSTQDDDGFIAFFVWWNCGKFKLVAVAGYFTDVNAGAPGSPCLGAGCLGVGAGATSWDPTGTPNPCTGGAVAATSLAPGVGNYIATTGFVTPAPDLSATFPTVGSIPTGGGTVWGLLTASTDPNISTFCALMMGSPPVASFTCPTLTLSP